MREKPLGSKDTEWKLELYIAGNSPGSQAASSNLRRICAKLLGDNYSITIYDLEEDKELWRECQLLALPTVIRRYPKPERRVVGDLSATDQVIKGLGLPKLIDTVFEEY